MPISAPKPNSSPSVNRVEALTTTAAASTSAVKRLGGRQVAGDDGLGVAGAVPADVVDGAVEVVDDRHAHLRGPGTPGRSPRRSPLPSWPGRRSLRARSSPTSSTPSRRGRDHGQEGLGHGLVHDQRLGRVADARPLGLGVDEDVDGHVQVGGGVDVDVAVAVAVDHVRHGGVGSSTASISDGPPRGIRQSIRPRSRMNSTDRLAAGVLHQDHGVGGQPGLGEALAEDTGDGPVGGDGRLNCPAGRRRCRT